MAKYIIEMEDVPSMREDGLLFFKCVDAPWWYISDRHIKRLKPYDAPIIHPEPPKMGKWISCKEKLPQEDESVLVTSRGGRQHVWNITRTVAGYLGGLCWEDDYGYYQDLNDAVAWQPLPELYKEEDDD